MSDAPYDRDSIWRRARERAEQRGHIRPETPSPDPSALPTTNLFALRGLLHTNNLTTDQASAARRYLAEQTVTTRPGETPNPSDTDGQTNEEKEAGHE